MPTTVRPLILLPLALLLSLPACKGGNPPKPQPPVEVALDVEGMTCGSCENAIQTELGRKAGVVSVRASHTDKKAWISYDPKKIKPEQLAAAIKELGYKVTLPQP